VTRTSDGNDRLKRLIKMADALPPLAAKDKSIANRVMVRLIPRGTGRGV